MAHRDLVLAGDIGGTKTHLALFALESGKLRARVKQTFASRQYPGLEPVLAEFLTANLEPIRAACFGVAGPVVDGRVKTPNLPWVVDAKNVAAALKLNSVTLLNDLEAAGYGVFTLEHDELFTLNQGVARRPGNKALIAAGTGLGEATLYDDGRDYHPLASEGGHADFAPRTDVEIELLRYLIAHFGRASYERVVSGPGLFSVYGFLKERGGLIEPSWLKEKLSSASDPSAEISRAALSGEAEICMRALDIFVSVYGAEAGNVALRGKAIGGIYVGGGIALKILDKLKDGTFMRAFKSKGRYTELLSSIPVQVILNNQTALRGAAYYGAFRSHG